MKTIYHEANSRGDANHGWLKSKHTFSFANYYDPNRMGFGALRVINDDHVEGGQGFGPHPHRDMEIISIALSGKLKHGDNMGHDGYIQSGEIQVMSAGTGIMHSEMNGNPDQPVQFLQIWVIPREQSVSPRYQQIKLDTLLETNKLKQILSPNEDDDGVWIHQDAWFSMGSYDTEITETYTLHKEGNGVYVFVLEGDVIIGDQTLYTRDALGVWDTDAITMTMTAGARVLVMEIPMEF